MNRQRREEGGATLEVVLLTPLLIVLLALIIGAGRLISIRSAVEAVAREAARSASQALSADGAFDIANARANEVASEQTLDPSRLQVSADIGDFDRGSPMTVRVNYLVRLDDLPAFGLIPGSFELSARHVEIVERYKSR
jgi:Flp pilus assembly protein TadG